MGKMVVAAGGRQPRGAVKIALIRQAGKQLYIPADFGAKGRGELSDISLMRDPIPSTADS